SPCRGSARTGLPPPSAPASPARAWAGRRAWGSRSPAGAGSTCRGCRCSSRSRGGSCGVLRSGGLRKDVAGTGGVAVHLLDQGRQVIELFLVAQVGDEFHFDPATVQVGIEIEQVCLQQRLHTVDRRPGAEAGD